MFKRATDLLKRLAKSALENEALTSAFEMLNALWPFYMGAVLLEMFLQRRWALFFINLAACCLFAFSSFMLLRTRRKTIEEMRLDIKAATEVIKDISFFVKRIEKWESDRRAGNLVGLGSEGKIWWPKIDPKDVN